MPDPLAITLIAAAPVVGSLLGCAAWRIPRGMNWVTGRSVCDSCGSPLGIWELVPIISYIALRGRCRRCGAAIPKAWPAAEASALAAAAVSAVLLPPGWAWAASAAAWTLIFACAAAWTNPPAPSDPASRPAAAAGSPRSRHPGRRLGGDPKRGLARKNAVSGALRPPLKPLNQTGRRPARPVPARSET